MAVTDRVYRKLRVGLASRLAAQAIAADVDSSDTTQTIQVGQDGQQGYLDVFPATADKGKLRIQCTDQTGDTVVTLAAGAMAAARTITIPDPGAAANVLLTTGTATATDATTAEITAHCDASARIVNVTASATSLALTNALHANRIVLVPIITGSGLTITLPAATGTGDVYTILNNGVQTLALTVTALAGDLFYGRATLHSASAGADDSFLADQSDDIKYTFNVTTTGGIGKDRMELIDVATDQWYVFVDGYGSGTLATGFA